MQNQIIEIGFNIVLKPIVRQGLFSEINDYEIVNKEARHNASQ
jgi:hypothetical protein